MWKEQALAAEHIVIDIPEDTLPKRPSRCSGQLMLALAAAIFTTPVYASLSVKLGIKAGSPDLANQIVLAGILGTSSEIANVALAADKYNALIEQLPAIAQFLYASCSSPGNFAHLAADVTGIAIAWIGSISLTYTTYTTFAPYLGPAALLLAAIFMVGRTIVGASALIDLKNNLLWLINMLRDKAFKDKEELKMLFEKLKTHRQLQTADGYTALLSKLNRQSLGEEQIQTLIEFAAEYHLQAANYTLLNKELLGKVCLFGLVGIPGAIIYYPGAYQGLTSAFSALEKFMKELINVENLKPSDTTTKILAAISIIPTIILQGLATSKALYSKCSIIIEKVKDFLLWLKENVQLFISEPSNALNLCTQKLKASCNCSAIYSFLKKIFNIENLILIIGALSSAAALNLALAAGGESLAAKLILAPPASISSGTTNIVSMENLAKKLQTFPIEAKLQAAGKHLDYLYETGQQQKLEELRTYVPPESARLLSQQGIFSRPQVEEIIIDMPEELENSINNADEETPPKNWCSIS